MSFEKNGYGIASTTILNKLQVCSSWSLLSSRLTGQKPCSLSCIFTVKNIYTDLLFLLTLGILWHNTDWTGYTYHVICSLLVIQEKTKGTLPWIHWEVQFCCSYCNKVRIVLYKKYARFWSSQTCECLQLLSSDTLL